MASLHSAQSRLFDDDVLPSGLEIAPDFVSHEQEGQLLRLAADLPFREARYKEYTARRRVFAYGTHLDRIETGKSFDAAIDFPPALESLRQRLADWSGIEPSGFVHALVSEYRQGTPLGWHRDAPQYEFIAGLSIGSTARMRFRRWCADGKPGRDIVSIDLAPRSAYLIRGEARSSWQHSLPPVSALRYSVTMRTARHQTDAR